MDEQSEILREFRRMVEAYRADAETAKRQLAKAHEALKAANEVLAQARGCERVPRPN